MATNMIGKPLTAEVEPSHGTLPDKPAPAPEPLLDSGQPKLSPHLLQKVTPTDVENIGYVTYEALRAYRRFKGDFELVEWGTASNFDRNETRRGVVEVLEGRWPPAGLFQMGYLERRLFKAVVRTLDPRASLD